MIKHLKIENFKSIKQLEMDCRRINILIGEPNSGKSNFLESLAVFAVGYTNDLKQLVRYDRVPELFFDQEIEKPIQVQADQLSWEIVFHQSAYNFKIRNGNSVPLLWEHRLQDNGNSMGGSGAAPPPIHPYYFPSGSLGASPHPDTFLRPPFGNNFLSILMTNRELREMIADIVQKSGMELVLKPHENRIELQKKKQGIAVSWPYRSLSDTLQRVIFHYVAIESNKNATLVFEEPESYAFPYYTKFLGETIARDSSNQYFIATHNPYFLFSIIEKAPKEDLSVLVTYLENEETRIKRLDEKGIDKAFDFDSSIFFNLEELINE